MKALNAPSSAPSHAPSNAQSDASVIGGSCWCAGASQDIALCILHHHASERNWSCVVLWLYISSSVVRSFRFKKFTMTVLARQIRSFGWPPTRSHKKCQRVGSCYLEVSLGTTGVDTWCYLECYLVLPGALPGVTWCYLGVAWRYLVFYFGVGFFFFVVPKYPRFSNSNLW